MTRMLAVMGALAVAGCGTTTFAHRTKGAEDFRVDKAQCHAQAFQGYGSQTNMFVAVAVMRSCLEGKGWYEVEAPATVQSASTGMPR